MALPAKLPTKWPTQKQWSAQFATGIKAAQAGALSAELGGVTDVLTAVFESEAGKQLGKTIADVAGKAAADTINGLMTGALSLPPKLVAELGMAAAQFASVIPVFAAAWEWGEGILADYNRARFEKLKGMTQASLNACKAAVVQIQGTGAGGATTPADLFRPVWEARQLLDAGWKGRGTAPLCLANLICALCGDESPLGWREYYWTWLPPPATGHETGSAKITIERLNRSGAAGFAEWVTRVRKDLKDPKLGIPHPQRKRMAKIIRGIMASVRPYEWGKTPPVGDQGRALWPVLMDILLAERRAGHWTEAMLPDLQQSQMGCYYVMDRTTSQYMHPVINLGPELVKVVMGWKSTIEDASALSGPEKVDRYKMFTATAKPIAALSASASKRHQRRMKKGTLRTLSTKQRAALTPASVTRERMRENVGPIVATGAGLAALGLLAAKMRRK
jgi:hypothetical protein